MSVMPCFFNKLTMCCIIGLFIIGTIGFGMLHVRGRSLVPNPPDMITAFIGKRWLMKRGIKRLQRIVQKKNLSFNRGVLQCGPLSAIFLIYRSKYFNMSRFLG